MRRIVVTLLLVAAVQANTGRIIDGDYAEPGQFPYISLLEIVPEVGATTYASGTIISDRYILTDAYSLHNATQISVTIGSTNLLEYEPLVSRMEIPLEAATVHPLFERGILLYSIATIKLPQRIHFTHLNGPIRLPRWTDVSNNFADLEATVIGYGKTKFINPPEKDPEHLRFRKLEVIDNDECAEMVNGEPGKFEPELICTVSATGLYDNGSPLTVEQENGERLLIGTLSHTYTKVSGLTVTTLNFYTRITSVLDFIEQSTSVKIFD